MNSTTTQPNLLELAKQGNAHAIAALINRQLQPKGITAKAALKDGCLQLMLESAQTLNQQVLVAFVRKGITGLGAASIERVKVYGRQIGEEFPIWNQEFELFGQQLPSINSTATQLGSSNEVLISNNVNVNIIASLPIVSVETKDNHWYEKDSGVILLLLLFWPVGLYLMWKHSKWSKTTKWSITTILGFMSIVAMDF